jgi:hypothetical protein
MKPPKCSFCSVSEWRHICGGAINKPNAINAKRKTPAINKASELGINAATSKDDHQARMAGNGAQVSVGLSATDLVPEAPRELAGSTSVGRSANRRAKADYNVYMKDYMRKRRASQAR